MTDDRTCPFCSGHIVYIKSDENFENFWTECQTCFARGPVATTASLAFDFWKSRQTGRIATFESREAALVSIYCIPGATPLYDQFPGHDTPAWALGIFVSSNEVHYLRANGTYK